MISFIIFALQMFVFSLANNNFMIGQNSDNQQNLKKMVKTSERNWNQYEEEVITFAKDYSRAWCCQKPENVAFFYAENGSLTINSSTPSIGRTAITQSAKSFMDAFPDDIMVSFDKLVTAPKGIEFHWTLTGTNTGPNGTGNKVNNSGFELWQLDDNGLIKASKGTFDEVD